MNDLHEDFQFWAQGLFGRAVEELNQEQREIVGRFVELAQEGKEQK